MLKINKIIIAGLILTSCGDLHNSQTVQSSEVPDSTNSDYIHDIENERIVYYQDYDSNSVIEDEPQELKENSTIINWNQTDDFDSLFFYLQNCLSIAKTAQLAQGSNLELLLQKGNIYYNKAYDYSIKLQDPELNMPEAKIKLVTESLKTYSHYFNDKYSQSNDFSEHLNQLENNLIQLTDTIN